MSASVMNDTPSEQAKSGRADDSRERPAPRRLAVASGSAPGEITAASLVGECAG